MDLEKKKKLEEKGWKVGNVDEFLGLSREESEYIELKIALGEKLSEIRKQKKLTQVQFAKIIETSQPRLAKMEKGDPSVSIDLLIRSLFLLGLDKKSLAKMIA